MNAYRAYFDRQMISAPAHERLLELEKPCRSIFRRKWALSALCCGLAVILGAGLLRLHSGWRVPFTSEAAVSGSYSQDAASGESTADRPMDADADEPPAPAPEIRYPSGQTLMAADIALPEGGFFVDFSDSENAWAAESLILRLEAMYPEYRVEARGLYDGSGNLWLLTVSGMAGTDSFTLELSPGHLPPKCIVNPAENVTVVEGVEVTGWSAEYTGDNGNRMCCCDSEFIAGDYGISFENVGAPALSEYYGQTDPDMGGAMEFNARFVEWALKGNLVLEDSLLYWKDIPAWETKDFSSLEEARQETAFAPYLPERDLLDSAEFEGRLNYQEGVTNSLFISWFRGYLEAWVSVYYPEGTEETPAPVDVAVPESYDVRLYPIPWADSVPQEYVSDFYSPLFRAEDMSLEIIEARGWENDEGEMGYHFEVLHENGVQVRYDCEAMTAQEVWEMVSQTIPR